MRPLFLILAYAGGLVLLVLAGIGIAVWAVDPNELVGPLQARIRAVTGRDITIGGGIDLKLGLVPKLVLNDVRVGNAPGGVAPNLVAAKRVEFEVALLPLLRRNVELVRLELVEPTIALETNRDGRGNWDMGAASDSAAASGAGSSTGAFAIGNLAITRGELTYRDGATGVVTRIAIDALALSVRDVQSPIAADFRGKVDGTAVALAGKLGSPATLAKPSMPFAVAVKGEIAGRKLAVAVKVRRADDRIELQDIDVTFGSSAIKGTVDIQNVGAKATWTVKLASSALDVGDLPAPSTSTSTVPAASGGGSSRFVFPEAPVSFDLLRARDVNGEVAIDRLTLPGGRTLERVGARFTLHDGKLDAPAVHATVYGGTISGALTVDATRGRTPLIALRAQGRELALAALLAAAGVARETRGGKTNVVVDVTMRGDSPHQWMSGINGHVRAVAGPATFVNAKLDPALAFDRLAQAVNPFRAANPTTEVHCAVIRLPLANGIAHVDRSIAMETKEIDVAMTGTLDFRTETLDLAIRPRIRQGIPIEIPQIAELVRFRGPFAAPAVTIDATASAATLARIGAAIGTGGLSLLGESVIAQGGGGAGACDIALGKGPAPSAKPAHASPASSSNAQSGADDLGKALEYLFRR